MQNIESYKKINSGFTRKFIFNLGSQAGFYSEFNNMVFAILFCLKYKYRFILYSGDANFKVLHGWEDFFEPFCDSVNSSFHKKFNKRINSPKLSLADYPAWYTFKLFNNETYLTFQLFHRFFNPEFEKEYFNIPELGINGNLREASRKIVDFTYRFNSNTRHDIEKLIASLNLPSNYVALNIRRGDKDTEFKFVSVKTYVSKLLKETNLKDVFVLTDDYTVIEEIQLNYPFLNLFTYVNHQERGYIHSEFIKISAEEKRKNLIKLFASIEIICSSALAIGTFTTNPGLFIGMRMPEDKFYSVQKSSWFQFEQNDITNYLAN